MNKMNKSIEIGVINTLVVQRVSEPGIYLESEDREEVLLPNAYVTKDMLLGSLLDVFIYTDSEDRLVATTLKPYLYLNEFACLKVVDSANFGSFVDIGLPKDILVPKNKQRSTFFNGAYKVLQLKLDGKTHRLYGTEKYTLDRKIEGIEKGDEVEILIYAKTPLGFKAIVNNTYEGMIFHSEVFENVNIGDKKRAYVKNVREDNKLDVSLQKIGQKVDADRVLDIIKDNGGEINFTYKSEAEDIKNVFAMSKKTFKATLTSLIENKKITLLEKSIKVNN